MSQERIVKADAICDVGLVRQNNEDMLLVGGEFFRDATAKRTYELSDKARFVAVVADGIGGVEGGEFASEIACKRMDEFIIELAAELDYDTLVEMIKEWANDTHRLILEQGATHSQYAGMGTTLCGMLFYESLVVSLNIGDSRLYRYRGDILRQLSTDHSMRQLTGDADTPSNLIYNSLGAGDKVFVDIKNLSNQIFQDDVFLICSDGLSDLVSDDEIEQILATSPSAETLVNKAKESGARDNTSVVLLTINQIAEQFL